MAEGDENRSSLQRLLSKFLGLTKIVSKFRSRQSGVRRKCPVRVTFSLDSLKDIYIHGPGDSFVTYFRSLRHLRLPSRR